MKPLALFSKPDCPQAWGVLNEVIGWAKKKHIPIIAPNAATAGWTGSDWENSYCEKVRAEAGIAIAIGGDGTLLGVARSLFGWGRPILGVNMGTLGYLTEVSAKDIESALDNICHERYSLEPRILLNAQYDKDPTPACSGVGAIPASTAEPALAFNDVVIRSRNGKLAEYDVYVDGKAVFNLKADGLIVTTPTGSTAYALSAQGPILHPSLDAVAIVPLVPHSLTSRPITLPASCKIEIVARGGATSRVYCDGQPMSNELIHNARVLVSKAPDTVSMMHMPEYDLFNTLRHKLHWGTPRD